MREASSATQFASVARTLGRRVSILFELVPSRLTKREHLLTRVPQHVGTRAPDNAVWPAETELLAGKACAYTVLASRGHGQGGKGAPTVPTRVATHALDLHE